MTIHTEHPFADPRPDPVRRLRGRLGGAVSLWTSGSAQDRAGLTVSSLMVAAGEPARVLGLVDPDSDLAETVQDTGRCVVALLEWPHRDLAEAFAGQLPAPGGPFTLGEWEQLDHGPRLRTATTYAVGELESAQEVGWSTLLVVRLVDVVVGEETAPLQHRRGRYVRP